jgi:hypothetical protein
MHGKTNLKNVMGCDALFTGTSYRRIGKVYWRLLKVTNQHGVIREDGYIQINFRLAEVNALSISVRSLPTFVSVFMHLSFHFPEHTICIHL